MKNLPLTLVTGASKGIGKAIASRLAQKDTCVICIAKTDDAGLQQTVSSIQEKGFYAYPALCDVSDYSAVTQLFQDLKVFNAPIHTLVNNAGISHVKLFTETTFADWTHIINTNLTSAYTMCSFVVPDMLRQHKGNIINISSIWGNDGASMEVAYSASTGGLNSFTKALAKELGPSNIRVNALACGVIDTGMNTFLSQEERDALTHSIAMARYGTPEEVAECVYGLLYHSPYLTGQVITYDGGMC